MATNRQIGIVIASITCLVAFTRVSFAVDDGDENGINGMPHNGLAAAAFRINALTTNKQALATLTQNKLREALLEPYIAHQLLDPNARAVLQEIIRCALPASDEIGYTDANGMSFVVRGELGLCKASDPDLAVPECQEFVTACVAARVNALHKSIPLSLRSVLAPLASPGSKVSTVKQFRERVAGSDPARGILIGSFQPSCAPGQRCGWQAAYIGTCNPGNPSLGINPETVSLAIDDAACSSATLRVCAGIHGCLGPDSGYQLPPGFPTSPPARYLKFRNEKQGVCAGDPLTFQCPTDEGVAGYFSTMVLLDPPGPSPDPYEAVVKRGQPGAFPATEADAFGFIEGAFYGNLFRLDQLKRSCEVSLDGTELVCVPGPAAGRDDTARCQRPLADGLRVTTAGNPAAVAGVPSDDVCLAKQPALPYADLYACYSYAQQQEDSTADDAGAATLNSRLCDLPGADAQCFPHPLKRCHYKNGNGLCTAIAGRGGAYGECQGEGSDSATVYHRIVTTYLNEPCDVIGEGSPQCTRLRDTLPGTRSAGVPAATVAPGRRGCGGCAIGDADGGAACTIGGPGGAIWPVLVALVVRGWRRRRRPQAPAAAQP
jgi:hypothetical protein